MELAPAAFPQLNRAEWQAVAIAINDASVAGCSGSKPRGRIGRWIARMAFAITGNEMPRPLADQRLESLRGLVCSARRQRVPDQGAVAALIEAGFTQAEIDALVLLTV